MLSRARPGRHASTRSGRRRRPRSASRRTSRIHGRVKPSSRGVGRRGVLARPHRSRRSRRTRSAARIPSSRASRRSPTSRSSSRRRRRAARSACTRRSRSASRRTSLWEGSEEVVIEYQDVKITADEARYDFPTKTAVLIGHVVIDQGPTRLSGVARHVPPRHEDGRARGRHRGPAADVPHRRRRRSRRSARRPTASSDGIFTACDVPEPGLVLHDVRGDHHARRLRPDEGRRVPRRARCRSSTRRT